MIKCQDEAFSLWKDKWAALYPENSKSREILNAISDNYFLVNLVDNEFPKNCCLWKVLQDMLDMKKEINSEGDELNNNNISSDSEEIGSR